MPLQSRGQETTMQFTVDNALLAGSFLKLEDWEITPDQEIKKSDFVGETESEGDIIHNGIDFKFTIRSADAAALDLLDKIVAANEAGLPLPNLSVTTTIAYRDPGVLPRVLMLSECVIKMDSLSAPSRKDYLKNPWSGFARKMKKQGA